MTWHPLLGPGLCRNLGEGRGAGPGPEQRRIKQSSSTHPAPTSSITSPGKAGHLEQLLHGLSQHLAWQIHGEVC